MASFYEEEKLKHELYAGNSKNVHMLTKKCLIESKKHEHIRIKFKIVDAIVEANLASQNFAIKYLKISKQGYLNYKKDKQKYLENDEVKRIREEIIAKAKRYEERDNGTFVIHKVFSFYLSADEYKELDFNCISQVKNTSKHHIYKFLKDYGLLSNLRVHKENKQGKNYPKVLNYCEVTNVIQRNFKASEIYEKLASDITTIGLSRIKLKVLTVVDFYSGYVWSLIKPNITQEDYRSLLLIVYKSKLKSGSTCSTIIHTDQGTEFVTEENYAFIRKLGFIPSVSDRGKPIDNSLQERFYGHFKETLNWKLMDYMSLEELVSYLEMKLHNYIYSYPRNGFGGLTPDQILKRFG